ncbi:S8 family serine peptidase [Chelatococcus sp. GCM10030263]|uniref:S8 family serine peptidase n=1 Tax=Chelatococcus sp. GCM10030263 TaxID=3273387 RepID=UPI003618C180
MPAPPPRPRAEDAQKPRQAQHSIVAAGLSDADLARLTARGIRIAEATQGRLAPRVARLHLPAGMSVARARSLVAQIDRRATSDLDHFYYTDEGPPNCTGPGCRAALIGWQMSEPHRCGAPPLIGMIDTGIDRNHDALRGQSIEIIPGPESGKKAASPGHGTAIAALLVGRSSSTAPGLLPDAKLIAVDAFYNEGGTADRTDVISIVSAMETLAERGVRIINLSFSGPPNEALREAIAAVLARGIVVVAAAGNRGAGAEPAYPAAYPGVIAVTAVDGELGIYHRATQGDYVDLAAPGVDVMAAQPGGGVAPKTGTSYAVPFVTAAAALVRAAQPDLDLGTIRTMLENHTRDLGRPGRDPTFGWGLIEVAQLCPASPDAKPVASAKATAADTAAGQDEPIP